MLQTREGHQLTRSIELRDPGSELDCLDVWQLPCVSTQLFGPTRHIPFLFFLGTVCESQRYSRAGALQEEPGRFGHVAVRGSAVFIGVQLHRRETAVGPGPLPSHTNPITIPLDSKGLSTEEGHLR